MVEYDTADMEDMAKCLNDYSISWIKKCQSVMGKDEGTKHGDPVKAVEPEPDACMSGDVCPACGSSHYYRSGTCFTCRNCSFSGGCG